MIRSKYPLAPTLLALTALGLGGFIFFFESRRATTDEAKEQHARLLPGLEAEMVRQINYSRPASASAPAAGYEIIRRPGASVIEKKAEPFDGAAALRWDLTHPVAGHADRPTVNALISRLRELDRQRRVTPASADLKPYGLDPPAATLLLRLDPKRAGERDLPAEVRLELGGPGRFADERYLRDGGGAIYVVSGGILDGLNPPLMNLRDKRLFDYESADIETIAIAVPGAAGQNLARAKERWTFTAPVSDWADSAKADDLLSSLQFLGAEAFIDEAPAASDAYGLKSPAVKITVTPKKGAAQWLALGAAAPAGASGKKLRYARSSESPAVVSVEESLLEPLLKGEPVARDPVIVPGRTWGTAQFGAGPQYRRAAGPGTWSFSPGDKTREPAGGLLDARLEALQQLRAAGFGEAIAGREKALGLDPPWRTLKLADEDKTALEIRLGAETPQGRVLQIVGRPATLYIAPAAAEFFSVDGREFLRAKAAAAPAPAKP